MKIIDSLINITTALYIFIAWAFGLAMIFEGVPKNDLALTSLGLLLLFVGSLCAIGLSIGET